MAAPCDPPATSTASTARAQAAYEGFNHTGRVWDVLQHIEADNGVEHTRGNLGGIGQDGHRLAALGEHPFGKRPDITGNLEIGHSSTRSGQMDRVEAEPVAEREHVQAVRRRISQASRRPAAHASLGSVSIPNGQFI